MWFKLRWCMILLGGVCSLREEREPEHEPMYMLLLGPENVVSLDENHYKNTVKNQLRNYLRGLMQPTDRLYGVEMNYSPRKDKQTLYVGLLSYLAYEDLNITRHLTQERLYLALNAGKDNLPGDLKGLQAFNPGEITNDYWLQKPQNRCSNSGNMGNMDLQVKMQKYAKAQIFATCDVHNWIKIGSNWEKCINTRQVSTMVTGEDTVWVKMFTLPIEMAEDNWWYYFMCTFWAVPDRFGDQASPKAQKLCSIDYSKSYYCTWKEAGHVKKAPIDGSFEGYAYYTGS